MAMGLSSGGKRGRRRGRRSPMAEINVTPLVDVMLVLLIIFMVTAPLLTAAVPLELPDSRANPVDSEAQAVTLSIDRQGVVYIDDRAIPPGGVAEALAELPRGGGKGSDGPDITLRADRALDYGRVMAVMGELNRAGLNRISLVTSGVTGGSSAAP